MGLGTQGMRESVGETHRAGAIPSARCLSAVDAEVLEIPRHRQVLGLRRKVNSSRVGIQARRRAGVQCAGHARAPCSATIQRWRPQLKVARCPSNSASTRAISDSHIQSTDHLIGVAREANAACKGRASRCIRGPNQGSMRGFARNVAAWCVCAGAPMISSAVLRAGESWSAVGAIFSSFFSRVG